MDTLLNELNTQLNGIIKELHTCILAYVIGLNNFNSMHKRFGGARKLSNIITFKNIKL